jgi:hypothetical protein
MGLPNMVTSLTDCAVSRSISWWTESCCIWQRSRLFSIDWSTPPGYQLRVAVSAWWIRYWSAWLELHVVCLDAVVEEASCFSVGTSAVKIENRNGDRNEPWGTPAVILRSNDLIWNALATSRNRAPMCLLLLKLVVIFLTTLNYWSVVEWCSLKPNCSLEIMFLFRSKFVSAQ